MKRIIILTILLSTAFCIKSISQTGSEYSKIDILLVNGDYKAVIDTCNKILEKDSLNAEITFKLGLAYQNILSEENAMTCFQKASSLKPENKSYKFMVAKSLYNKGKTALAKPIFSDLYKADTLNWVYAYYLTSSLMQEGKFDESIDIYYRFYFQDTLNYTITDKIGYAYLKKNDYINGIAFYNKSLAINEKNITAIKNLAYLYAMTYRIDTGIVLLSRAIKMEPAEMDLYARRAALNFSKNYTKRALDDYLKIMQTGDTSTLYLKRVGIGYTNNLQVSESIPFLLKAYKRDTTDNEVINFLARNYEKLKELEKSEFYYFKTIRNLSPYSYQLYMAYYLLAEVYKRDGKYEEAIFNYLNSQKINSDPNISLTIANLYDEKIKDPKKAIFYYDQYLNTLRTVKPNYSADYVESIMKRVEYLKNPKPETIK